MTSNPNSGDCEKGIVERVLSGDVDAFEEIVERWQGPLLNLAYRFCRDRAQAEEMAQEAFLKIYRNLARWRGEGKLSTWMFSVALNHYRTTLRRERPPSIRLTELDATTQAGNFAEEMDAAASDRVVRQAVALLPAKYRDTIVLYYFHQQDVSETAATLGLRPGSVKARLHRARKLLEQQLRSLGHPLAIATQESTS